MPKLISTAEVARKLGVHHYSICRVIRDGRLPAQKIGRTWVVREEDVEELARDYVPNRGRPRKQLTTKGATE